MNRSLYPFAATAFAMATSLPAAGQTVRPPAPPSLNLTRALGGKLVCAIGNGSIQFLSQNILVVLAGPTPNCYTSVRDLELITLTTDGHILARKPWPSTFPFAVLDSRVAIGGVGDFSVLNDNLQTIQTLPIPTGERSSVYLEKEGTATLLAKLPRGETFAYEGSPLAITKYHATIPGDQRVLRRDNGDAIVLRSHELITLQQTGINNHLADLSWLHNCNSLCQSWSGATKCAVSANGERAVFVSSGTRLPLTDDSGMFPFWRVVVIDLSKGKELYRKEFDTKTSLRTAQLSPDGNLLLLSDGNDLQFRSLP